MRLIALAAAFLASLVSEKPAMAATAYDFSFRSIDGTPLPLSSFAGKAVLVVNTASFCGFTPQYTGLQALWERYRGRGLVVLGVPSDDFGRQEPGSAQEIKDFCEVNYRIDFPLAEKSVVSGDGAHPFYRWAAAELGFAAKPRWNFHKYLIAPDGRLVDWFSSVTAPDSRRLVEAVEAALPK
ncbi:glutathione peroxidase [Azospirillum fermentarium]|uniref:glutathione peroxidase n=1 Tax=Azospirillum fermentarium TaxID=1233114 RepID=UPI0022275F3F|nr:glutathione peroxidase [Azospirillum fermentarium]MCW2247420.1 glutathione peroxidase [Azospirillum fermentarium]